jgi:hypothetical protein
VSGPILDFTCTVMCPHGGQATVVPSNINVTLNGAPAILLTDVWVVAGCTLVSVPAPPCVTIQWSVPSMQVSVSGVPVLLQTSLGLCLSAAGAPLGTAIVVPGQVQVTAQ